MNNKELLIIGNLARDLIAGREFFGGSAASIAINFSRLGGRSSLLSVLGRDDFSTKYRHFLQEEGIDMSMTPTLLQSLPVCEVISDVNSNASYRWTDNDCHPTMENLLLDSQRINNFEMAHLVSCPPGLAKRMSNTKVKLSYEPGPMINISSDYFDLAVVERATLLFFNKEEYDESLRLSGFRMPEDFKFGILPKIVVVTKDEQGSDIFYLDRNSYKHIVCEAIKVPKVVDHTGAGDAYKAGFLAGYIRGLSLQKCGSLGSIMGSACVTQTGGIVTRSNVETISLKYLFE